jgi:hypothetical protein
MRFPQGLHEEGQQSHVILSRHVVLAVVVPARYPLCQDELLLGGHADVAGAERV